MASAGLREEIVNKSPAITKHAQRQGGRYITKKRPAQVDSQGKATTEASCKGQPPRAETASWAQQCNKPLVLYIAGPFRCCAPALDLHAPCNVNGIPSC